MSKSRELKWHEELFGGIISAFMGLMFLFNGFSYLTTFFLDDSGIKGGPTKQKGIIAFLSLIENSWWKYLISLALLLIAFSMIRAGLKNYKSTKE